MRTLLSSVIYNKQQKTISLYESMKKVDNGLHYELDYP